MEYGLTRIYCKGKRTISETNFELKTMKTTEELRAARKGPLELKAVPGSGGGWMTDASGDLVEEDEVEEMEGRQPPASFQGPGCTWPSHS